MCSVKGTGATKFDGEETTMAPRFVSHSQTFRAVIGDTLVLPCEVEHLGMYIFNSFFILCEVNTDHLSLQHINLQPTTYPLYISYVSKKLSYLLSSNFLSSFSFAKFVYFIHIILLLEQHKKILLIYFSSYYLYRVISPTDHLLYNPFQ